MHRIFVLLTAVFLMVSCNHGANQPYGKIRTYHFRFNPPDSSIYHYNTSNETFIIVTENDTTFGTHRTSQFAVNYLVSKDSNEVMLDMTFDKIDYHERNGFGAQEVDVAAVPGPARELLSRMKTATIFVRVHQAGSIITMGGVQELVDDAMDPYYAEGDRSQARAYWGQWAEQELVWKNLDPFVWVTLDSVRHPGGYWTDTSTNAEEINFKINKRYQLDTINAGMATIWSQGRISNDKGGTWLSGKAVTGILIGNESGRYLIDTATGMPGEMQEWVSAEGDVQIEGHKARLKIVKTIRMVGGKLK